MSIPNTSITKKLSASLAGLASFLLGYPEEQRSAIKVLLLRGVAASLGGLQVEKVLTHTPFRTPDAGKFIGEPEVLEAIGSYAPLLATALDGSGVPPGYGIGVLAETSQLRGERRLRGEFYTDYRLAELMIGEVFASSEAGPLIDPSVGAGAFLVAALRNATALGVSKTDLIRTCLYGLDLSSEALDACFSSLLAEVPDIEVVSQGSQNLVLGDTLLLGPPRNSLYWRATFPSVANGFKFVVGNPPWEKLKLHAHEFSLLSGNGIGAYGTPVSLSEAHSEVLRDEQARLKTYVKAVRALGFKSAGSGDPDSYKFFLELATQLTAADGELAMLLPGGILRSQGARGLRRGLRETFNTLEFIVFDNRARFFPIDTRFKFVALHASNTSHRAPSQTLMAKGALVDGQARKAATTRLQEEMLHLADDSIGPPEVFTDTDRDILLQVLSVAGSSIRDWGGNVLREVDMTFDRNIFTQTDTPNALPVIEGRMVHNFSHGAKSYSAGAGRSATWIPTRECVIRPQFYVERSVLPKELLDRVDTVRAGFCDVTGQTNERTLLASLVPSGVICGNKVPTVLFPTEQRLFAWLALMNSFVIDWVMRKLTTTSINFFILDAIPLPDPSGTRMEHLARLSARLSACDHYGGATPLSAPERGELRARIDIEVALELGLDREALQGVFSDFPLIDRSMPTLPGEKQSTITRDCVLAMWDRLHGKKGDATERYEHGRRIGAVPYVPTDLARALLPNQYEGAQVQQMQASNVRTPKRPRLK